jgi:hypothetical protein
LASHHEVEPPRRSLRVRKPYRVLKWVVIALIAASMAEFLALDMAMLVATDLVFYFELLVVGWAMTALAFLNPAFGYRFITLGARIFGAKPHRDKSDED